MKQNLSTHNQSRMTNVTMLLGIVLSSLLSGCQFFQIGLQPQPTFTETPFIPTLFVPTPDCGVPTVLLGSSKFQIETFQAGADGTLPIPPDRSGVAYWVEGTNVNYTFVLSPTPENLAVMSTLTADTTAKVTWSNCNSTTYTLSAPQPASFSGSALPDQSAAGITIFIQTDASGAGSVVRGELTEEQISTFDTPVPGTADIQAEISLLETTGAPDGGSIRVGVSIQNYGAAAFTLSGTDVTLTQPDGTPVGMLSSDPPLPKEIVAGATETIYFFFYRPAPPTATLRVFTVEYELGGY